jgi:glycine cleavage system H protein
MAHENPKDYHYAKTHEWVKSEGTVCLCGLTDHAQESLTDIVFVELPELDKTVSKGEQIAVVESVKSVSDIYAPVSGKVVEVNQKLASAPELINDHPYSDGWIFKIECTDTGELDSLLTAADYEKHVLEESH